MASPPVSWLVALTEIVTVGLPFCAFKLLTGLLCLESVRPLGFLLLALGGVDLLLNVVNLSAVLTVRRRVVSVCCMDMLLHPPGREDLGIALDVFLSFGLVAVVIGGGLIPHLPPWSLPIWNVAVVLNVLGAGIGRLLEALRRRAVT